MDEIWAHTLQRGHGGGGDRPHSYFVIAVWVGFVLGENRGSIVTGAHASHGIGIMHP